MRVYVTVRQLISAAASQYQENSRLLFPNFFKKWSGLALKPPR